MDTEPILVVEDATVLPTNSQKERWNHSLEGHLISTTVEEQAPHGTNQGVKCRCVSRPPKIVFYLLSCGYTIDEVRDSFHGEHMLEEENVIEIVQEDVQFPPSSYQQEG